MPFFKEYFIGLLSSVEPLCVYKHEVNAHAIVFVFDITEYI